MKRSISAPRKPQTPPTPVTPKSPALSGFSFARSGFTKKKAVAEELDPFLGLKGDELIKARLKYAYKQDDKLPRLIDDEYIREQSLDDYYIKLKIVLQDGTQDKSRAAKMESVEGNKRPIDITELFGQVEGEVDSGEASKLLLLGAAGIGKSTLMHYMSYRWSCNKLWNDKYDFVFRVRLKNLLNNDWNKFYNANELRDKILECFVHSCLPQELQQEISVDDIVRILSGSEGEGRGERVLLLLDGYDEVASKVAESGSVPAKIFDQVFKCENIILTSRPNAIRDDLKKQFERVIENVGLDQYGIEQYIDNAFSVHMEKHPDEDASKAADVAIATDGQVVRHSIHEDESGKIARFAKESQVAARDLKDFLSHNSTIKDICTIPINTALVCLIWRDAREKLFAENFNMSTLYKEVVLWLGKRHLKKFNEKFIACELEQIDADSIYDSNELKSLKKAAYRGFADSEELILSGKEIKKYIKDIWPTSLAESEDILDLVHKFGLLKSERDSKNLLDNDFTFIHLTFQEYLMALSFREMLENNDILNARGQEQTIGDFLATHREEPRYLRSLQFLTAIIEEERTNPDQTATQTEKTQIIVTRFWEAMSCNINGIIELGIEGKVKLLMYLLGQVKETEDRNLAFIPNLQKMKEFVDDEIFKDIDHWIGDLKASEYIPQRLDYYITEKLGDIKANEAILSSLFELISIAKYSTEKLTNIMEGIIANLNESNTRKQVETEEGEPGTAEANKAPETDDWRLQKAILTLLPKMVRDDLDFGFKREIIVKYQRLTIQNTSVHNDVNLAAISNIAQLASNMEALEKVIAESLLELQSSNYDQDSYVRTVQILGASMRYSTPEGTDLMQQNLLPMLDDKRDIVRISIVKLINKSIQLKPDSVGMILGYLLTKMLYVLPKEQDSIVQVLGKCLEKEGRVADVVLSRILPQLKSKNLETKTNALKLIEKCILRNSQFITTEFINEIILTLKNAKGEKECELRNLTSSVVETIIRVDQQELEPKYTEYVFNKLRSLLKSWNEEIKNMVEILIQKGERIIDEESKKEKVKKIKVKTSTKNIENTTLTMANQDKSNAILDDLLERLGSDDQNTQVSSLKAIVGYAKVTNIIPKRLLDLLPKLLKSDSKDVRVAARNALSRLLEVMKESPAIGEYMQQAFDIINSVARDNNYDVKQSAGNALSKLLEVMKESPAIGEYMQQAFDIINSLAHDSASGVRAAAGDALSQLLEVMKDSPAIGEYMQKAFDLINSVAHAENFHAKAVAVNALFKWLEVMKESPAIGEYMQAFDIINFLAQIGLRVAAGNALSRLLKVMKESPAIGEYMQKAFDLINSWAHDNDPDVRAAAGNAVSKLLEVMKDSPAIGDYMQKAFDLINSWGQQDSDYYVRAAAGNAVSKLLEVMKDSPAIGEYMQQAFDLINSLAQDSDSDIRQAAGNALSQLLEVMKDSPAIGEYMQKAFDLINSWGQQNSDYYVRAAAGDALSQLLEVMKDSPAIGEYMQKAFDLINSWAHEEGENSWVAKELAVNALSKLLEVMKDSPAIGEYTQKAFDLINSWAHDSNSYVRNLAGNALSKLLEVMRESPAIGEYMQQAFDIINSLAHDSASGVRAAAGDALSQLLEVMKDSPAIGEYMQQAFDLINYWAHAENDPWGQAKAAAGDALSQFLEVMKDSPAIGEYIQQAFDIINSLAQEENRQAKEAAVNALSKLLEVMKDSPAIGEYIQKAFDLINSWAHEEGKYSWRVTQVVRNALSKLLEVMKDSPAIGEYMQQAFDLINSLAQDSDSYVRKLAVNALSKLLEVMKDSPAIGEYIQQAFDIINSLAQEENRQAKEAAVNALSKLLEVMKDSPAIGEYMQQAFDLINSLAQDSDSYVRKLAVNALSKLLEVMKDSPAIGEYIQQAFDIINSLAQEENRQAKEAAVNALSKLLEVMKDSPAIGEYMQKAFDLINSWAHDSDNEVRVAAGNALSNLLKVMKDSPAIGEYIQQAFDVINSVARDNNYDVKQSAGNALSNLLEVIKDSLAIGEYMQQAFDLINSWGQQDSDYYVRAAAGNALSKLLEVMKDSLAIGEYMQQAFDLINSLAQDSDSYVRESAGNALSNLLEVMKDSPAIFFQYSEQTFNIIQELAGNKTQEIAEPATEILGEYLYVNPTLANEEFLFKLLAYWGQEKVQDSLLKGISVCIAHSDDYKLAKKLSEKYLSFLESDDLVMKKVATIALANCNYAFLKAGDYSFVEFATSYLDAEQSFKEPLIKAMAEGIDVLANSAILTNLEKIAKVAAILKYNKQIKEEAERELVEDSDDAEVIAANEVILAAKKLLVILPEILSNNIPNKKDYSEFVRFLEFINAEFDSVYSDGVRKSFEKLYVKVLEFEALNSEEMLDVSRELILKLLAKGFTTSFDLRNNQLIFFTEQADDKNKHAEQKGADDKNKHAQQKGKYKITSDSMIMQEFAEQAAEGAANLGNKLALQYVEHAPLFVSSGSAVAVAGTDIASCTGVLSRQELDHRTYNASLVVRSNHEDEVLGSFILLEHRLVTGQYRYCKITVDSASGNTGGAVKISDAVDLMPSEVRDNLSVIFDKMEYAKIGGRYEQPLYYVLTRVSIDRDVIKELLLELNGANVGSVDALSYFAMRFGLVGDREEGGEELVDNPTYSLTEFKSLSDVTMWHKKELLQLEDGSDEERVYLENEASFKLQQFAHDKDYSQKQITELYKLAEDLKAQFETLDKSANDTSNQFALLQEVNDTSHQRIDALIEEQSSLQSRLDYLKEKQEADHRSIEEMDQVKGKISELNSTIDEVKSDVESALELKTLFEQLVGEADILTRAVETQKIHETEQAEINSINSDPYKKALYETLRMELNAGYLAATSIESGWISNNKQGKFGKLGSFVKEVSGMVPIVGAGVNMLGTVLQMADSKQQKKMIKNYAKFVVDVSEMNKLAEEVSRKIILSEIQFKNKPEATISSKIKAILMEKVGGAFAEKLSSAGAQIAGSIAKIPTSMDDISDMATEMLSAIPSMLQSTIEGTVETLQEDLTSSAQDMAMEAASDRLAGAEEASKQVQRGEADARKIAKIITASIFAGKVEGGDLQTKTESVTEMVVSKFNHVDDTTANSNDNTNIDTQDVTEELLSSQQDEAQEIPYAEPNLDIQSSINIDIDDAVSTLSTHDETIQTQTTELLGAG